MTWTIIRGILYLLCFFIDPLVYALKFEPVIDYPNFNRFQYALTFLLVFDMALEPFFTTLKTTNWMEKKEKSNKKSKKKNIAAKIEFIPRN